MKPDCGRVILLVLLCFAGRLNARPTSNYDAKLIKAAKSGQEDLVSSLLDLGADINHEDSYGSAALPEAARKRHADVVSQLIEK